MLKEAFRKFRPRQQAIITAGCEQRAWNGSGKPETCLRHAAFRGRSKGCSRSRTVLTVCMGRDLRYRGVRSPELVQHP